MTDEELKRARELVEGATPGLNSPVAAPGWCWEQLADNVFEVQRCEGWTVLLKRREDAHFIAASRALVPKLLNEIERLKRVNGLGIAASESVEGQLLRQRDKARGEVERLRSGIGGVVRLLDDHPGMVEPEDFALIAELRKLAELA
jgi:hypothetical protein